MTNTVPLNSSVVVFSKNYLPVTRVNIKRAIVLLVTGKAEPVDFISGNIISIRSSLIVLLVPEHIRLTCSSGERLWKIPPVNRRELLKRDHHCCQYCGNNKRLTIDHIIPVSKGGKNTWDNVVIACENCNQKKGDRTPLQAGMPLKSHPKPPMHPTVAFAEKFWHDQQDHLE